MMPVVMPTMSAVAAVMERVDMAIVGAEAVVESGGVVNRSGTFQLGIICAALKKLKEDGTYDTIMQKYFNYDIKI